MTTYVIPNNRLLGIHRNPVSPSANRSGDWLHRLLRSFTPLFYNSRIVGGALEDLVCNILAQTDQSRTTETDLPLSEDAISAALSFLDVLPSWMAAPEIILEPEGDISFEWYKDSDHLLSVICSEDGILYYSGIIGQFDGVSGKKLFRGSIPEEIINPLLELGFGQEVAAQTA